MRVYKQTFWICGGLGLLSLGMTIISSICKWQNIFYDISLGIFASSVLVELSTAIIYYYLIKKTKALLHYRTQQLIDSLRLYKLFLQINPVTGENKAETLKNIVSETYHTSLEVSSIFYELSLEDVTAIDSNIFQLLQETKKQVDAFAIELFKKPEDAEMLIKKNIDCISCKAEQLSDYLGKNNYLK